MDEQTPRGALLSATFAGMEVIRDYQTGATKIDPELKANGTFLTVVDKESGAAILDFLSDLPLEYAITAEDTTGRECSNPTSRILSDGLDGTSLLVVGIPSSTVINAEFNLKTNRVSACCIGCPATQCAWYSDDSQEQVSIYRKTPPDVSVLYSADKIPATVWEGELGKKATLFMDVSRGFHRGNYQVLTDDQHSQLFKKLASLARVNILGSNGLMHALTANGGFGVCGGITTAMDPKGGWDAAGGYLVKKAGGSLRAYSLKTGKPEEVNPLNVEALDLLIFGNSEKTANQLNQTFLSLF